MLLPVLGRAHLQVTIRAHLRVTIRAHLRDTVGAHRTAPMRVLVLAHVRALPRVHRRVHLPAPARAPIPALVGVLVRVLVRALLQVPGRVHLPAHHWACLRTQRRAQSPTRHPAGTPVPFDWTRSSTKSPIERNQGEEPEEPGTVTPFREASGHLGIFRPQVRLTMQSLTAHLGLLF
jgi:hypothetical protein